MAHNPNVNYVYPQTNYYMEEPDGFIADYPENEIITENQQGLQSVPRSNITEIYTRKAVGMTPQNQMVPNEARYHPKHNHYVQPCYYENALQLPRTHIAVPLQSYNQAFDHSRMHQHCPISGTPQLDPNFDANAYISRSAHHNVAAAQRPNHPVNYQDVSAPQVQKQQSVKRYPITVGTPKYYRKPPANAVFKRPSALCLPVPSQPDPATTSRRPKKPPVNEAQYCFPQDIPYTNETLSEEILLKKQSESDLSAHKMDSEGDVNMKITNLDDILSQFETGDGSQKQKSGADLVKYARFLKPRVPSTIKARQDKMKFKSMRMSEMAGGNVPDDNDPSVRLNVQEVTEDSLEKLLNQLKKCELEESLDKNEAKEDKRAKLSNERRKENDGHKTEAEKTDVTDNEHGKRQTTAKISATKSFNYQDISDQMLRSRSDSKSFEEAATTSQSSMQDITKRVSPSVSATMSQKPKSSVTKAPLDDHCALELHRSKSYIVNLIDRALSKELGTIPSERNQKEFHDMSPRRAIDMVNRHTYGKPDDLCLEITSALTDSIISNATAPECLESRPTSSAPSRQKICCCNEEPTYIKQLKQLRWGHLKHIQREVRRLEDLERFLDSCSLNTISEF